MMEKASVGGKGLFESVTSLAGTLVSIAYTRLELLSTDLEEERVHLIALLVLALAALFFIGMGLVLAAIFLVAVFWESHRLLVLGSLAGIFLVAGLLAGGFAMHKSRNKPKLFAASLSELHKDQLHLDSRP